MDDAEVIFLNFPVLQLVVENAQGRGGFGGDDDAAGVPVDPVDQGGGEAVFRRRVVFPFFIEIPLYPKQEGVAVFLFVRMHQQAGFFVQQQQIVVFIDNIQLPGCRQKVINRRRFFQKFVFQIQGKHITGLQTC